MKNNKLSVLAAAVFITVALSLFVGYYLGNHQTRATSENVTSNISNTNTQASPTPANSGNPFLSLLAADESNPNYNWGEKAAEIVVRLFLAVLLSAILAFRPRKNIPLFQRNLYVAQTQILLAVVAAALMMIVGDNTARAFAIFAAVSLVRFRTNIHDPKEITVLLISLSLGLAAGVGHWELGLVLCLFVLVLLWFLEYKESEQVFRAMELTVKTKDTKTTQDILKRIFTDDNLEAEIRQVNPTVEEVAVGTLVYFLNLRINLTTDNLSEKIFSFDANNIESIQWKQQKSISEGYK